MRVQGRNKSSPSPIQFNTWTPIRALIHVNSSACAAIPVSGTIANDAVTATTSLSVSRCRVGRREWNTCEILKQSTVNTDRQSPDQNLIQIT